MTILGARPQFIKAAAVSKAFAAAGISECIVHTGQHFDHDMSRVFFEELGLPAVEYHLGISGGGHGEMTGRMLAAIEPVLRDEAPDWVLVYGDTNSTLAGSLAASKLNLPVAHVEAGLRSFNRRMPEEINRVVTDHLSTLRLCPTTTAVRNLAAEGITAGVHNVGDVMYDVVLACTERARGTSRILEQLGISPGDYAVATIHRAENTEDRDRLAAVFAWLAARAQRHAVICPLHPRTRKALAAAGIEPKNVRLVQPVGYLDMTRLLADCIEVYTDSGGLQKEAYFHQKPCVTLRDETEWVETIDHGWNRLWTVDRYTPRRPIDEYGDGRSATKVARLLLEHRADRTDAEGLDPYATTLAFPFSSL